MFEKDLVANANIVVALKEWFYPSWKMQLSEDKISLWGIGPLSINFLVQIRENLH